MHLLDHVSITVADLRRAQPFYEAIMAALGAEKVYERADAVGFGRRNRPGDGEPGLRPHYHAGYYAAFLKDPEGNRVEAVFHGIE